MIPKEVCPKIYFVKELPTLVICHALFYVKPDGADRAKLYISDNQGNYILVSTGTGAGVSSVTGTGVTGTASNPIVDILTFLSEQTGNALQISEEDGKLYLGSITAVHNELEEIQGGTEEERYHLTETEHTYLTDVVSNDTIGFILETLESILYVAPDITNFTITPSVVEIGTTVTNITLNWNLNKTLTSLSINNGVGSITPNLLTLALSGLSLSSNTTYTITGGDGTNTDSASTTLNFRSRRWWGTSALDTFTGADILDLQNSELATNRQQTRTINGGGDYIWFAFPTSFGLPTFNVNGLPNTAFTTSTVSHTNASGNTQNYYVIRTNTVQNGTLTIQIL